MGIRNPTISKTVDLTLKLWNRTLAENASYNQHESLMQQSNDELRFWKHPWTSPAFVVFASFLAACPLHPPQ